MYRMKKKVKKNITKKKKKNPSSIQNKNEREKKYIFKKKIYFLGYSFLKE